MTDNNSKTWTSLFHSSRDYEKRERMGDLKSKSRTFYIDPKGIALSFEPADNNPFVEEETEKEANYTYGRQFKDSYIGTLKLPKEWKDGVSIGKHGDLELSGWWFDNEKYGNLRWPSTAIGNLEFY